MRGIMEIFKRNSEYFMKTCITCEKPISRNCKFGYCNKCRDRTGKNNPFYGKHHSKESINATKIKLSKISKSLWKIPEYRNKVITKSTGLTRSNEFKQFQRASALKQFTDNKQRILRSDKMKESWRNGAIVKGKYSSNHSKLEDNFFRELQNICPTAVQHPALRFSDRSWARPDIFIENLNLIIEFYGDYWHANPEKYKHDEQINGKEVSMIWYNDEMRIAKIKAEHNLETIIVWQHEYKKDKTNLFKRLDTLINWDACGL